MVYINNKVNSVKEISYHLISYHLPESKGPLTKSKQVFTHLDNSFQNTSRTKLNTERNWNSNFICFS